MCTRVSGDLVLLISFLSLNFKSADTRGRRGSSLGSDYVRRVLATTSPTHGPSQTCCICVGFSSKFL